MIAVNDIIKLLLMMLIFVIVAAASPVTHSLWQQEEGSYPVQTLGASYEQHDVTGVVLANACKV